MTEAQGSHGGYTYTQRVCQEYGQQPRWYQVRDEMAGNDWRSDGGWAIVLVTSSRVGYTFGAPRFDVSLTLPFAIELTTPVRREQRRITDRNGVAGFIAYHNDGSLAGQVIIDRDNDGDIDINGDRTGGFGNALWEIRTYTAEVYGVRYIRWANMQWCR